MKRSYVFALSVLLCGCLTAAASDQKSSSPNPAPLPHLSKQTRLDLIHGLTDELMFIRTAFPMGKRGLTLKDGVVSPSGAELQQLMSLWGPSVKPGDEARITSVIIKEDKIRFEINGGPIKKQKWYQHIQVGAGGSAMPDGSTEDKANPAALTWICFSITTCPT